MNQNTIKSAIFTIIVFALLSCTQKTISVKQIASNLTENIHDIEFSENGTVLLNSYGTGKLFRASNIESKFEIVLETDSVYLEQIKFTSDLTGYICGNFNNVLKTVDGGKTWQKNNLSFLPGNSPIYGMDFKNDSEGIMAYLQRSEKGIETIFYSTTDGAETWEMKTTVPNVILNLEYNNDMLWASGTNILLNFNSSGESEIIFKDTSKTVGQIRDFIIDENKIFMASFRGYFISGKVGFDVKKVANCRFRSIAKLGNSIFLAGDNSKDKGFLFESKNGGESWSEIETNFPGIHRLVKHNNSLYGVGKNGLIFKINFTD